MLHVEGLLGVGRPIVLARSRVPGRCPPARSWSALLARTAAGDSDIYPPDAARGIALLPCGSGFGALLVAASTSARDGRGALHVLFGSPNLGAMASSMQRIVVIGAVALATGAASTHAPPAAGDRSRAADGVPAFVATGDVDEWYTTGNVTSASITQGGSVTFESRDAGQPHDVDFGSAPVACSIAGGPPATRVPSEPALNWFATCTFNTVGRFDFYCNVHAGMTGEVRVVAPDTPPPPPPGTPSPPPPPGAAPPPPPAAPGQPGGSAPGTGAATGGPSGTSPVTSGLPALEPVFEFAPEQQGGVLRGTIANAGPGATATIDVSARRRDLVTSKRKPSGNVRLRRLTRTTDATGSTTIAVTLSPVVRRAVARLKRVTLSIDVTVSGPRVAGASARGTRRVTLVATAKPPPLRATVAVRNNFFTPRDVRVRRGGTITWTWRSDGRPHDVAGPGFKSAFKSQGTYKRTFKAAGSFAYVCTLHDGMRGRITVR